MLRTERYAKVYYLLWERSIVLPRIHTLFVVLYKSYVYAKAQRAKNLLMHKRKIQNEQYKERGKKDDK
jgi:hypothetical protein